MHRKAGAQFEANKQNATRLARHGAAAEAALGAAAWHSVQGDACETALVKEASSTGAPCPAAQPRQPESRQMIRQRKGDAARGRDMKSQTKASEACHTSSRLSHEELVAQARAGKQELSIGGKHALVLLLGSTAREKKNGMLCPDYLDCRIGECVPHELFHTNCHQR